MDRTPSKPPDRPQDLSAFIVGHLDVLTDEWIAFARTLPGCRDRAADELRDHAGGMLRAIADDIRQVQTPVEQAEKSEGRAPRQSGADTGAESHGAERFAQGFGPSELVAEFRALRATVLRRWMQQSGVAAAAPLGQLMRFNEGIDQAVAETVARFVAVAEEKDAAAERAQAVHARLLQEHEERVRRADERLHRALQEACMAYWEWSPRTDRLLPSATLHGLYGLPPGQPFDTGARALALVHPDDRQRQQALVAAGVRDHQGWHARFRVIRPSTGQVAWLEERATPADDSGTLFTGLVWDITERVASEEALRDADQRKDRFLATLAHELRNPLAPIRQAAAVARSGRASAVQMRWSAEVIHRQAARLALLLDDLLDVSRLTRGRLTLRCREVDVAEVVRSAVETVSPQLEARQQDLRLERPVDALSLHADPLRLSQVLSNLLTNASRYSGRGSRISLAVRRAEQAVELCVADEGIGIAADRLQAVFEMFGRDPAGEGLREGGLGVGLALARGLVELHGGTLVARSAGPGQGAEFVVRLPAASSGAAVTVVSPADEARSVAPERILVIDDYVDAADSLAAMLRLRGHEVRTAYGGQQGLDEAARFRPGLVLLDLGMPHLDGFEVARRLRAMEGGAGITLVAVSGWGLPADRARTRAAGFDFHLTKPMDEAELAPALDESRRRRG